MVGENASAEKPTDRPTKRDGRAIEGGVVIEQEEEEEKPKTKFYLNYQCPPPPFLPLPSLEEGGKGLKSHGKEKEKEPVFKSFLFSFQIQTRCPKEEEKVRPLGGQSN